MGDGGSHSVGVFERAVARLSLIRFSNRSARSQKLILILSAGSLLAIAVIAWVATGFQLDQVSLGWVAVLILTAPLTILLSAVEYQFTVGLLGGRISSFESFGVAVVGHLGNYLPFPGSSILRVGDIQSHVDRPAIHAAYATASVGAAWLTTGCLTAAGSLAIIGESWSSAVMAAVGGIALAGTWRLNVACSARPSPARALLKMLGIEMLFVILAAIRLGFGIVALGVSGGSVWDALVIAASGPLAAMIGVFPGGIGIREGFAALLGEASGIGAAAGAGLSILLRIIDSSVFAVTAVVFLRNPKPADDSVT